MNSKEKTDAAETSLIILLRKLKGFPYGLHSKESAFNVGNPGSFPGLGRSPGEGNGNPLRYSCLENSINRETWLATIHGSQRFGQ